VTEIAFVNLLIVVAVAFGVNLGFGLVPALRLPAVVLEIVAGIALGPSGVGWVEVDEPVAVLALIGLAMLLFLAGLEIEFERLRGRVLALAAASFGVSLVAALAAGIVLKGAGLAERPLFVAIVLTSTSLGIVVPLLKDAGEAGSRFGQLVIAAASIADFGGIVLLSLFFSRDGAGTGAQVVLLGLFAVALALVGLALVGVSHSMRLSGALRRLQDTTAQIRVRGAFVLVVGLVALAQSLGLEVILGAFAAGAILALVDRDRAMTHPEFRTKLQAIGFGVFVPVFFVTSGLRFDLGALFAGASTLARVPAFLLAILVARALPALVYRRLLGSQRTVVAGLLQATTLPFVVAATQIGLALGAVSAANAAALVAAALLSVLLFPVAALALMRRDLRPVDLGVRDAVVAGEGLGGGATGRVGAAVSEDAPGEDDEAALRGVQVGVPARLVEHGGEGAGEIGGALVRDLERDQGPPPGQAGGPLGG
jgi:Kef-type K+ transport system membrane component KefB